MESAATGAEEESQETPVVEEEFQEEASTGSSIFALLQPC